MWWRGSKSVGLGFVAVAYVAVDYLRYLSPTWHARLQPVLWSVLALLAVARVPFYKHWSSEFRSAIPFVASMLFLLSTFLLEAISVRSVTAVLGLDWHRHVYIYISVHVHKSSLFLLVALGPLHESDENFPE